MIDDELEPQEAYEPTPEEWEFIDKMYTEIIDGMSKKTPEEEDRPMDLDELAAAVIEITSKEPYGFRPERDDSLNKPKP